MIREMLGEEPESAAEEILQHIDPVPLATGSIGQAHLATFRGAEVVVKIRRHEHRREEDQGLGGPRRGARRRA
ncbi:AarF/UbiB family protein, partial [Kocuria subflava]|uniref:AarF/UbiB family protein n=1 Tax=Kocuria subflava TaxID=1736139 RepID=UPI003CC912C6